MMAWVVKEDAKLTNLCHNTSSHPTQYDQLLPLAALLSLEHDDNTTVEWIQALDLIEFIDWLNCELLWIYILQVLKLEIKC